MRRIFTPPLALATLTTIAAACGGSPAPGAKLSLPRAAPSTPPPRTATDEALPVATIADVPAPAELQLHARIADPIATLDRLKRTGLPQGPLLALGSLDNVITMATGLSVGKALDLHAPIDVAILQSRKSSDEYAISIGVTSASSVTELLPDKYQLEERDGGVIRIVRGASDHSRLAACEIAPAYGPARERLVCATSTAALETITPYLTRTATRIVTTATLYVDAPGMVAAFAGEVGDGIAKLDNGAAEGNARADRLGFNAFIHDLEGVAFEVTLTDALTEAAMTLRLRGLSSPYARLLAGRPDREGPAPDAFWRLPADASTAFFAHGVDASDLDPARSALFELLTRSCKEDRASAECDAIVSDLAKTFLTGGPFVVAYGLDRPAASRVLSAYRAKGDESAAARSVVRLALQGWTLVEVEEPSSRWSDALRDLVSVDQRARATPARAARLVQPATLDRLDLAPVSVSQLPSGTVHATWKTTPNPKALAALPPTPPVAAAGGLPAYAGPLATTMHLFVVPDGARTWLAFGEDEAMVTEKLRVAVAGVPSATLAGRAGMDMLRTGQLSAGGFITVGAGLSYFSTEGDTHQLQNAEERLRALAAFPHRGDTPLPVALTFTPTEGTASAGAVSLRFKLPSHAMDEVVAGVTWMLNH